MDTLRGHDAPSDRDDFDYLDDDAGIEAPPAIGSNERRMHVRAYNYWASLLGDKVLPSIEDLDPEALEDFGPHSVLLDFTSGIENPAVAYLGHALRRECEIEGHIDHICDVPARSLLSRLTDHYLQIIANAAPIGFEAEFVNQRNVEIMYRGILMPFSSDDDTIDFVYGVINWKEVANRDLTDKLAQEVDEALRNAPAAAASGPVWADGPSDLSDPPADDAGLPELDLSTMPMMSADAGLGDRLALARDGALTAAKTTERSRNALYRAIGLAYDFALATAQEPEDYAELLADAGIKVQQRTPMTAVIKLVFGADYDKTRIAEYATALDHGWANGMESGSFGKYLEGYAGGLKQLVADERAARRAEKGQAPKRKSSAAKAKLLQAPVLEAAAVPVDEDGLGVAVVRREIDGTLSIVGALPGDDALAPKVLNAVAR